MIGDDPMTKPSIYAALGPPMYPVHCRWCHKTWPPRSPERPRICPACMRRNWDQWPSDDSVTTRGVEAWHQRQGHRLTRRVETCEDCQKLRAAEAAQAQT